MTDVLFMLQLLALNRRLRRRDRWTREQLDAHQARSLRRLRAHAYAHSPFYQRFHADLSDRPLDQLPVLTKTQVMEHFDELVTNRAIRRAELENHLANLQGDDRYQDRYWVNATSGSTGQRGIFLFDRSAWLGVLATFARAHDWTGMRTGLLHRMKTAEVASSAPWHMSARVGATIHGWWAPTLRLDAAERPETIVARLDAWQPEMLVAYPSLARILAEAQLAGILRIAPRAILTGAEVLTDETRRIVEDAWGKRLFNQYGATETGNIAGECERHTGLHVLEDLIIVEVVDRDNRPVPADVYGEKVLVTVLFNRTQPLIRYELSDSVRLAKAPCACGRPYVLIDGIQGRAEEVLRLPGVRGGEVAVNPNVFHRVMDTAPVAAWQVVQEPDGLDVLLSGARDDAAVAAVTAALRRELQEQGIVVPPLRVRPVPEIPRGATGKLVLIKSNVRRG
jgi:phenylacetate-CoA ligase